MASETTATTTTTELPELGRLFERLFSRHRDLSLFLPFILGFTNNTSNTTTPPRNESSPDQETPQTEQTAENLNDRIILINPFTQSMVVIEGREGENLEALFRELAAKSGHPPASKASIEAMPTVEVGESGVKDGECAVCLEEWELGGLVKEMPCNHRFHGKCIEKWLGIHGSCPVCRYKMPVHEQDSGKKRDEAEGDGGRSRNGREIWVSFSLNGNRGSENSNQNPASDSDDVYSGPSPNLEMEG